MLIQVYNNLTKLETCEHSQVGNATFLHRLSANFSQIHGYLSATVCVVGVFTNMANIIVLTRKNMISSTNWILMWLAVADLLTMAFYAPNLMHFYIFRDKYSTTQETTSEVWAYYHLFVVSFTIVCHTAAIWLTTILAIFRYIYIGFPTSGPRIAGMRNASVAILLLYVASVVVIIPNMMVNYLEECFQTVDNQLASGPAVLAAFGAGNQSSSKLLVVKLYKIGVNPPQLNHINFWIQASLVKILPSIILTVMTFLLLWEMRNASIRRSALVSSRPDTRTRNRENRTTVMLLAVVILFLVTELPQGVMVLWSYFDTDFYDNVYQNLGDIIDFVTLCNEAINFVLYTSMSRQFRETFTEVFFSCCPKLPTGWKSLKSTNATQVPPTTQQRTVVALNQLNVSVPRPILVL